MLVSKANEAKALLKTLQEEEQQFIAYMNDEAVSQAQISTLIYKGDDHFKNSLWEKGTNVDQLEKESEEHRVLQDKIFEKLKNIPAPPYRKRRHHVHVVDLKDFLDIPGDTHWLYPPAYDSSGDKEFCGINKSLGEFNIKGEKQGSGWGIQAVSYLTTYCTLWFYVTPTAAGTLTVRPFIDIRGPVALSAHDHWYTSTVAELKIKMHFDLYQHYWDGEQVAFLVNERMTNDSVSYWKDEQVMMDKTLSVSANDIVFIKLTLSVLAKAHSSYARVSYDFRSGANQYIRIPYIYIDVPR